MEGSLYTRIIVGKSDVPPPPPSPRGNMVGQSDPNNLIVKTWVKVRVLIEMVNYDSWDGSIWGGEGFELVNNESFWNNIKALWSI